MYLLASSLCFFSIVLLLHRNVAAQSPKRTLAQQPTNFHGLARLVLIALRQEQEVRVTLVSIGMW